MEYKVTGEDVLKIVYEKGGKVLIQYNDHNAFWLVACAETSNSSPIKFEDKLKDWKRSGLNCLKD